MRRASIIAVVAFVTGLAAGLLGSFTLRGPKGGLPLADTRAAELAAIEKLHQEDIAATLSQDPNAHANLWTDDAVRLGWGRPAEVGKKAILAENEKFWAEHRGLKVLSYEPQIKDLQVAGEWAFEWGNFEATFKLSEEAPPVPYRGKVLRVLRRQSDASWKFARVCENPQNAPGQQ